MKASQMIELLQQRINEGYDGEVVVCGTGDIIENEPDNIMQVGDVVWNNAKMVITYNHEPHVHIDDPTEGGTYDPENESDIDPVTNNIYTEVVFEINKRAAIIEECTTIRETFYEILEKAIHEDVTEASPYSHVWLHDNIVAME